ncbi:hypothetical protein AB3R30_15445 [Leptolyngbyaceae cyanobacterium UHCC 1019]
MKRNLKQTITLLSCVGVSITVNFLPLAQPASAEVISRMHGRCKLTNGTYNAFDGHCVVKQKRQGTTTIMSVELDNGSKYNFFGPSMRDLQVQTYDGLHNVQFIGNPTSGFLNWREEGTRNILAVKVDSEYPASTSYDAPEPPKVSRGAAIAGAAIGVGAVLAGILGNKNRSTTPANPVVENTQASNVQVGDPVPGLNDLVGARAGQAENAVRQRGYRFIKTIPSGEAVFSNWWEAGTNSCVSIRTAEGRYASIVYATPADCDR